jgi:hypothetical protein
MKTSELRYDFLIPSTSSSTPNVRSEENMVMKASTVAMV